MAVKKKSAPKLPPVKRAEVKERIGIVFIKDLDAIRPNKGPKQTPFLPIKIDGYDKSISIYRKDLKDLPHPKLYAVDLMDNDMYFLKELSIEEEMMFVKEKLELFAPAYTKDEIEKKFGIQ